MNESLRLNHVHGRIVLTVCVTAASLLVTLLPAGRAGVSQAQWREVFRGRYDFLSGVYVYDSRLLFCDSPRLMARDGGDVYLWGDASDRPARVLSVDEQGVYQIRRAGGRLVIPGDDATEDWTLGNVYWSADGGQTWAKQRKLPHAIHVLDVCEYQGRLAAATECLNPAGAVVMFSDDGGETWTPEAVLAGNGSIGKPDGRVHLLVPGSAGLYAYWELPGGECGWKVRASAGWQTAALPVSRGTHLVARSRTLAGGSIVLGKRPFALVPANGADRVVPIPPIHGRGRWQSSFPEPHFGSYEDFAPGDGDTLYALTSGAVAVGSLAGLWRGKPGFRHLADLPAGHSGWAMACWRGRLYVGSKGRHGSTLLELQRGGSEARLDHAALARARECPAHARQ